MIIDMILVGPNDCACNMAENYFFPITPRTLNVAQNVAFK